MEATRERVQTKMEDLAKVSIPKKKTSSYSVAWYIRYHSFTSIIGSGIEQASFTSQSGPIPGECKGAAQDADDWQQFAGNGSYHYHYGHHHQTCQHH